MLDRIEVITSHNVVVRFELASLIQRVLATFIDLVILIGYTIVVMMVFQSTLFFWLLVFPVWAFYHLAFEIFNKGQSLGKKILKIRVVSLQGRTAKVNDYLIRWVFRLIEVLPSLGSVALIFLSSSDKNQRIGDMLANTSVVKQKNENEIRLESIEKLEAKEDILYPSITQFNDNDMLLVKETIGRYMENPHEKNKAVLDELTKSILDKLNTQLKDQNQIDFLNRVLYEYVLLTR